MKLALLALVLFCTQALASGQAVAPTPAQGRALSQQQQQQQTQTSTSEASNHGNNQAITINMPGGPEVIRSEGRQELIQSGTTTLRNVPSVSGPPLTASNDTCMGSASASANGPGFGISVGSTWTDGNCVMLKNSRELWNMGMKAAALARMCMDDLNKEALELTDFECPQTARAKRRVEARGVSPDQYRDPYVRHRLGLPPVDGGR